MQGGLFGLNLQQKTYLLICQLSPAIITAISLYTTKDYLITCVLIQMFYIISSMIYIKFFSKEGGIAPYTMNELRKVQYQVNKGLHLGISAYLLIILYSMLIIKLGRVHLPKHLHIGKLSATYWYFYIPVVILNPILEQWFWRIFLPKTMNLTFLKMQQLNVTYLLFHFALFSHILGFWKSITFVAIFFSIGRSMSHIKQKYGIISAIVTHYGITLSGVTFILYVKYVYQ